MRFQALFLSVLLIILALSPVASLGVDLPAEKAPFQAVIDPDGVQRVEIVGGGYFFNPNHIIVKVNVPVELKVRKEPGMVPHNIVMKAPDAGIEFDAALGSESELVRFVPTKTGKFSFYCSKKLLFFESHREKGMEGILEVVE